MAILIALIGFFSGLLMMHGLIIPFGQYYSSGTLWGRNFQGPGNRRFWLMALGGLVLMGLGFVLMGVVDDGFDHIITYAFALPAGMCFSFYTWHLEQKKCFAGNHIISAVQDVPFMADLDRYAATADHIELGADGIVCYDNSNYPIGTIRFTDYRIGDIPSGQMFCAAYALAQKFNGTFKYSVRERGGSNNVSLRTYVYTRK